MEGANVGAYADWTLNHEESTLFQVDYVPEYQRTFNLDFEYQQSQRRLEAFLTDQSDQRASRVLSPENVESFFVGFVESPRTKYQYITGSFDTEAVRTRLVEENDLSESDISVEGMEVVSASGAAVAFSSDTFIWVSVGFGDLPGQVSNVMSTINGDRESYAASHEDYQLLFENLQRGHWIMSRPNEAKAFGANAYGRQYVIGPAKSVPEEVVVWEEEPNEEDVRAATQQNSSIISQLGGTISEVTIDGRVSTTTYNRISNSNYLRVSGYTK